MSEQIHWVDVKDQLPDDETTVLIYSAKHDEPVWFGFYEANAWFLPDGMPLLAKPTHWADMPAGPGDVTHIRVNAGRDQIFRIYAVGRDIYSPDDLDFIKSKTNATLILDDGVVL